LSLETLRPESDLVVGWDEPAGDHSAALADGSDATTVRTLGAGAVDRYGLPPLPSFVSGVSTLSARARLACGDGIGSARLLLFDGTNLVAGPTWLGPAGLAWFTWTPATAPDGGAWTVAKVNALELRLECVAAAFAEVVVAELEVPVEAAVSITVTRRPLVFPVARPPVAVPGARGVVSGPGGARLSVAAPGARPALVCPVRRLAVAAGPTTVDTG
jgi:hypothetical protein